MLMVCTNSEKVVSQECKVLFEQIGIALLLAVHCDTATLCFSLYFVPILAVRCDTATLCYSLYFVPILAVCCGSVILCYSLYIALLLVYVGLSSAATRCMLGFCLFYYMLYVCDSVLAADFQQKLDGCQEAVAHHNKLLLKTIF
jgi:hypothetical protein